MKNNILTFLLVMGISLMILSVILPSTLFESELEGLRASGYITLIICPIIGITGIILTYKTYKFSKIYLINAFALITLAFPILWIIVSLVN